ncbi:MAG: hypothetical protein ACRYFU_26380 [Janthinobacterium lividum]
MATVPVVPAPENAIDRFIDEVKAVFVKAQPVAQAIETAAVMAEPILALTPAGPEYEVAVNAIVGAQQVAQASLAAGTNLTGTQKAIIAVQAATPALNTILTSKGVTANVESIISTWVQNVFNILAGPVAVLVTGKATAAAYNAVTKATA